jgi:hypothetical protein
MRSASLRGFIAAASLKRWPLCVHHGLRARLRGFTAAASLKQILLVPQEMAYLIHPRYDVPRPH